MPNREEYLRYLSENGLVEEDVLAMTSVSHRSAFLNRILALLAAGHTQSMNDQELNALLHILENLNANANILVQRINDEFCQKLEALQVQLPRNVFAGVFPTSTYNAQVVRRADGSLILIDNGAFQLIEAAIDVFFSDWDQAKKAQQLARMVERYCELGEIPIDDQYADTAASPSRFAIETLLTNSCEEFVLAHEYGHIIWGHLPIHSSEDRESEADLWALNTIGQLITQDSSADASIAACNIAGPIVFFGLGHLVEKYNAREGLQEQYGDRAYPPAAERILRAWLCLASQGLADQGYVGQRFLELVDVCCRVLEVDPVGIEFGALNLLSTLMPGVLQIEASPDPESELQRLDQLVEAARDAGILNRAGQTDDNITQLSLEGWFGETMPRGMSRAAVHPYYRWTTGRGLIFEMLYVPPGDFVMGPPDWGAETSPTTPNMDQGYYISRYPVTWAEYIVFCEQTGRELPDAPSWERTDRHPVVNVSWTDADAFCTWADISLPTGTEWEKAARGVDGRLYPWGNETPTPSRCIWAQHPQYGHRTTAPVDATPDGASPYGAEQMSGNVWEWCQDWFDDGNIASAGRYRVLRGGSFRRSEEECRVTSLHRATKDFSFYEIGFRAVRHLEEPVAEKGLLDLLSTETDDEPGEDPLGDRAQTVEPEIADELFDAVERGDLDVVGTVLREYPGAVDARDEQGRTALHRAASLPYFEHHYEAARLLLASGADVNARDGDGATPLHYVASRAQWFGPDFAELLLSNGANGLARRDRTGETPVDVAKRWAAVYGETMVHILAKHGFR